LSARHIKTVTGPMLAMRVNYVGELGYSAFNRQLLAPPFHPPVLQLLALLSPSPSHLLVLEIPPLTQPESILLAILQLLFKL
ncbi:MAG: hypothetical protein NTY21_01415, partial [Actinobacteria bacterium]|nr:hypothetical protein [Actinomycetota bacterium]